MYGCNPYGGGYGLAAMGGMRDMDAEENQMAVQHSFSSSFSSFLLIIVGSSFV